MMRGVVTKQHEGGLDEHVGAEQSDPLSGLDQHGVGKRVVAIMCDASARRCVLPAIPHTGLSEVVFRLDEKMLFQVGARRQSVVLDIVSRDDGNEMKMTEFPELNVR